VPQAERGTTGCLAARSSPCRRGIEVVAERFVNSAAPNFTPLTRPWSSPIEDTSIATPCAPTSSSRPSERCTATASGVVSNLAERGPEAALEPAWKPAWKPYTERPTTAVRAPQAPQPGRATGCTSLAVGPVTPMTRVFPTAAVDLVRRDGPQRTQPSTAGSAPSSPRSIRIPIVPTAPPRRPRRWRRRYGGAVLRRARMSEKHVPAARPAVNAEVVTSTPARAAA